MSTEDRIRAIIGSAEAEPRATEAEWSDFVKRAHRPLYMQRAATALAVVALVGFGAVAAMSLLPDDDPAPLAPASTPSATGEPSPVTTTPPATIEVPTSEQELWFVQEEKLSWGTTAAGGPVSTEIAGDQPPDARAAFWLELLLQGPTAADQEARATTVIPEGTELLRVMRNGTTLYVDLSTEFESGGGSLSMQMRVAQVVYTSTQFPGIDSVRIMLDGQMVDAIGGEGIDVSRPLTRRDFQDLAPNIVVESPRPGEEFSPGDIVTGFANVFEANVSFMITDAGGNVILDNEFTTATCGSGCWGDFEKALDFQLDAPQEGRVTVLTYSAEDGSPQDEISIPVMLVP